MLQTVFEIGADPRKSTVKAGAPDLFGGLPERWQQAYESQDLENPAGSP